MSKVGGSESKNTLHCSFCGKSQHEVRKQPPGSRPTSGTWVGGRASVLNILDVAVAQSEEEIEPDGLLDDDARLSIERYTSHRYRASALI
jgi:hypothetical protein